MAMWRAIRALGLMSGTSMDGVDAALLHTDGVDVLEFGPSHFRPYTDAEREVIARAQGLWPGEDAQKLDAAQAVVLRAHGDVIALFDDVEVIGFHGQTLAHDPDGARTHQLGDGDRLAAMSGQKVVWDFRTTDMQAGGQGAPLAPVYHFACARKVLARRPLAFLNLGGVGNVTFVDPSSLRPEAAGALLAFDTGPANAPINDLLQARRDEDFDAHGALAGQGTVQEAMIGKILQRDYFSKTPPKSLDRNDFKDVLRLVSHLPDADAAATLTALCAACVARARDYLPARPEKWLVCGGGRRNPMLMQQLKNRLAAPVLPVEDVALDGDMLEAQAFAYLAVRVLRGLPTSVPGTTGCAEPVSGGRISG
jgi:anhydro-N-acetylmuramic acid kinase